MINIRTVNKESIILQELILLYIIVIGVSYQKVKGEHFSFNFGIGPIELVFTLRLWNK